MKYLHSLTIDQFSGFRPNFCSCEIRMCSRRLYLFLKFLLHSSHLRGGCGVCWVRICLQRFTVVITILQNWHSVHLLLGKSKNIQNKNKKTNEERNPINKNNNNNMDVNEGMTITTRRVINTNFLNGNNNGKCCTK